MRDIFSRKKEKPINSLRTKIKDRNKIQRFRHKDGGGGERGQGR